MSGERQKRDIFGELRDYKDEHEKLKWEGSFEEYINMVVENPNIARSSFRTVYDALTSREDYFTTGKNALYGAEQTTDRFLELMKSGAEGLETSKRIILLVGPPGSGKSTLVNGTKRGIEEYSKTDAGAIYAIKGCPMQEEPLHLIPNDMRPMIEEEYGIHIEGDLCPQCSETYGNQDFGSDALREVPIERVTISEKDRRGIGTFKPSDPKSQDITELVGSVDLSKLGKYGTASDAKAYRFDGELNVANRGVMEFVEMLKVDEKFLYTLLDLTTDHVIKAPRFPNISADEVIIAHTNLAEYNAYVSNPKNEALRDRLEVIEVPYTLEVSAEEKIHQKLIGESDLVKRGRVHVNPQTLRTASVFAVLSRLSEAKKYTRLEKMRIYNGDSTNRLSQRDLRELQADDPKEGMYYGVSPRYIIDSLSKALVHGEKECLTPLDAIRALTDQLNHSAHTRDMNDNDKKSLTEALALAQQEYNEYAVKEVSKAFIGSFEDVAMNLYQNYISNVMAFTTGEKIVDPVTGHEYDPDEKLMRSIEEQINVSVSGKAEFRKELMTRIARVSMQGKTFTYHDHPRLEEAITNKLFGDMKDMIKLTTTSGVRNDKQQKRINDVERTLIEDSGYCEHCAHELVEYVGSLMARS